VSLSGLWGCSIMSASGSHVLALPHGGASAAGAVSVGHGRHRGVVQRMSPHSFERVGASGRWTRLERRAEVTGIDRGSRCRRHRAAWRLTRNVVALRPNRVGPDSFGHSGHQVGVRRTAGAFHVSRFGIRHRRRDHAPLGGSFERLRSLARFRRAIAHSTGRPTHKWSRRARRSGAILSPRRAAHLQRYASD
jgi:hypothetical protein